MEGKIEAVSVAYLGRENQHAAQVAVLSKRCSLITVFFLPDTLSPGEGETEQSYCTHKVMYSVNLFFCSV